MQEKSFEWKPIELWPDIWMSEGLELAFEAFRRHCDPRVYQEFLEKSVREWSITTGQIEGAYEIDRGITMTMIESGLVQNLIPQQRNGLSAEQVYLILMDHQATLDGLFQLIQREEPLGVSDIQAMHQELMRSVETYAAYFRDPVSGKQVVTQKPLEKGKFKEAPNSPLRGDGRIHEYCLPTDVAPEMRRLVELYSELVLQQSSSIATAAWLHHAFTQIHPFQDGNGRVARVLASFVLIKAGLSAFTVIPEMKKRYISALEEADEGNPDMLIGFVESCVYRNAVRLWHSLRIVVDAQPPKGSSLEEILQAAQTKLAAKHELLPVDWSRTSDLLQKYREITKAQLLTYANKIHDSIRKLKDSFHANPGNTTFTQGSLSVAWAAQWGEDLSQSDVHAEVIAIQTDQLDQIIVGFDSFHRTSHGLGGVFVALKRGESEERIDGCFLLHFKSEERVSHFSKWLTLNLNEAVRLWQQRLA